MGIRIEIFDVVMDKLCCESDFNEIESVLAPLYTDNRLKTLADDIFRTVVNARTITVEQALATGMGLEGTFDCTPEELTALLAPWSTSARLRSVADQIVAATRRMCDIASERARALGAQLGAGAAFLVFEPECEECENCGD